MLLPLQVKVLVILVCALDGFGRRNGDCNLPFEPVVDGGRCRMALCLFRGNPESLYEDRRLATVAL